MKKISFSLFTIILGLCGFASAIFGQIPCSENFVKNQVATGKIKAWDLAGVWIYLTYKDFKELYPIDIDTGKRQTPTAGPIDAQWQQRIKKLSSDFEEIPSIYEDDGLYEIRPGDLMIYAFPWDKLGAVGVVNAIDPDNLVADISIYFEKTKKTERNKNFQLSLDPANARERYIRPGLLFIERKECYKN